jgi:hypothetical protein
VIIAASTQTLDRFASHGIVARQPPPPEEMWLLMIDIRLWLLSVFRPDFDPLDAVNLWGRLGFLQILMDFNGSFFFYPIEFCLGLFFWLRKINDVHDVIVL